MREATVNQRAEGAAALAREASSTCRRAGMGWNKHDDAAMHSAVAAGAAAGSLSLHHRWGAHEFRFDFVPMTVQISTARTAAKPATAGGEDGDVVMQDGPRPEAGRPARKSKPSRKPPARTDDAVARDVASASASDPEVAARNARVVATRKEAKRRQKKNRKEREQRARAEDAVAKAAALSALPANSVFGAPPPASLNSAAAPFLFTAGAGGGSTPPNSGGGRAAGGRGGGNRSVSNPPAQVAAGKGKGSSAGKGQPPPPPPVSQHPTITQGRLIACPALQLGSGRLTMEHAQEMILEKVSASNLAIHAPTISLPCIFPAPSPPIVHRVTLIVGSRGAAMKAKDLGAHLAAHLTPELDDRALRQMIGSLVLEAR